VPAPMVRELAHAFGLLPRPAPSQAAAPPAAPDAADAADAASVDWTETGPVPGNAETEERITTCEAAERAAAADLATALDAEDRLAGGPEMVAARAERREALQRLLAARRLTGTALAHRPRIALVDQLSGTLLALTDAVELRQAATTGTGLGPPPATDAYRPPDPLGRFVRLRDRRCRFPGCRARARCADLDHQTPHPHGATAHDNLACLCEYHHRLSHQAPGWRLHRDDHGGLVWTLPGGATITTHPPALGTDDAPVTATGPPPAGRRTDQTRDAIRNWRPGDGPPAPDIPY
jgi:hypothetical protein